MKHVGTIASKATFTNAWAILKEDQQKTVEHEDLCLIKNLNGNELIVVIRDGKAVDENLNPDRYTPGTGRARGGLNVPSARKQDVVFLDVIGETPPLRQNRTLIAPQSNVFLYEDVDTPVTHLADSETDLNLTVGHYHDHPEWRIPVKPDYICYHTGVYGTTGCGKTMLTVYGIIPLLMNVGYHIIIMDWKGHLQEDGYARFFPDNIINWSDISLDEELVCSVLSSSMWDFGYVGEKKEKNPIREALEDVVYSQQFQQLLKEENELSLKLGQLREMLLEEIRKKHQISTGNIGVWGERHIRRFERYFRKLKPNDLKALLGTKTAADVVEQALITQKPLVVDLGGLSDDQKLAIFLAISEELQETVWKGLSYKPPRETKLQLALIIDEGPQYAPWKPKGIQHNTTEAIIHLCATGRSAGLAIVIACQGIAGEVGLNAAVRRNLNTQFIGKIGASDLSTNEVDQLIEALRLNKDFLMGMRPGLFYFLGSMNPSPKPLLISFQIPDEVKAGSHDGTGNP